MILTNERYPSVAGGKLCVHRSTPEGKLKAQVLVLHGYAEHAQRYLPLIQALYNYDIAVWAPDHTGHGKSDGLRGYIADYQQAVDDAAHLVDLMRLDHPNLPLFIFGHSMGGGLAIHLAKRFQAHLKGLILTGPTLEIASSPKWLQALAPIPGVLIPKVPFLPLPATDVSRDPEVSRRYREDPLNYVGNIRFGLGWQVIRVAKKAMSYAPELSLPIWLGHGEKDALTSIRGSKTFLSRVASKDVTFRPVPDARHEILNEPEGALLTEEIKNWILSKSSGN